MFTIHDAQLADLHSVATLFNDYRVWYRQEPDLEGAVKFLKARIENGESRIFLAKTEAEQAVGFTQLYPLFSSTRMRRIWLLNDLFVVPDYRGLGISKLLIDRAKQLVTDTDAAGILLETEKSNTIGNHLYPATGFQLEKNNFYFWTAGVG